MVCGKATLDIRLFRENTKYEGFEKDNDRQGPTGYEGIVADARRKRNNSIQSTASSSVDSSSDNLEIPTFLRKNKMGNK